MIDYFTFKGKALAPGLAKHAPISGVGVPNIYNILIAARIKNLVKLARGTLKGIPLIILENLGINPIIILKLSKFELQFLGSVFRKCNLDYWALCIIDYIRYRKLDMEDRVVDERIYEPISNSS